MPNGNAAAASNAVSSGRASRIARYNDYTGARQMKQVTSKPRGYSTERAMKTVRSVNKARGIASPSVRAVAETHKRFVASDQRTRAAEAKARKKAAAAGKTKKGRTTKGRKKKAG